MTEREWLAGTDPTPMLEYIRKQSSDRKLRLLTVSCCRLFWDCLNLDETRTAIEVSERFADGHATEEELSEARSAAHDAAWYARYYDEREPHPSEDGERRRYFGERLGKPSQEVLRRLFFVAFMANTSQRLRADGMPTLRTDPILVRHGPSLLRDVFGNPFRPATADPRRLTSTAVSLARSIYEDRAFDRMPILADALEEAGCDDADLLAHCRGGGPHARGCWAVDLLLGKE